MAVLAILFIVLGTLYYGGSTQQSVHSTQYTNIAGEQCGVASSLARDRFPWDVRLGYRRAGRLGWFCSGDDV